MRSPELLDSADVNDLREKACGTLEGLENLVELIREDASHPERVQTYSAHAERLLRTLRNDFFFLL